MKRSVGLLGVIMFIFFNVQIVYAANFTDIAGKNCEAAVLNLSERGIISGYNDGTFRPANLVTRAEFSKLITTAYSLNDNDKEGIVFTDVKEHWAGPYISIVSKHQLVKGYADNTFKPQMPISYAEMATVLIRAIGMGDQVNPSMPWPSNYIEKAKSLGIDSMMNIQDWNAPVTRGDVSIAIYNSIQLNNTEITIENASIKTYRKDANDNVVYTTQFYKNNNDKILIELDLTHNLMKENTVMALTTKIMSGSVNFKTGIHNIVLQKDSTLSKVYLEISLAGMTDLSDHDYIIMVYYGNNEICKSTINISTDLTYEKGIVKQAVVNKLSFFLATDVPVKEKRLYGTVFTPFPGGKTVWWDLDIQFPTFDKYIKVPISFEYFKNEKLWGEHSYEMYLDPTKSTQDIYGGIYTDSWFNWGNGEYLVKVYIFKELIAEGKFTIKQ